jgi:peptidoglycan/xylan/chitin deacetylase (PgdA/CDA1 family)
MRALTLAYHDVVVDGREEESGFPGPSARRYKLRASDFDGHLTAIAAAGRRPVSVDEALQEASDRPRLLLTFDDGGASALRIGELLASLGWIGHFFVPTDFIGRPAFLAEDSVRALAEMGHVVGSHSRSHPPRISGCAYDEIVAEWSESRRRLSDILDAEVTCGAVPGGFYSRAVGRAAAASGITALFTSEPVTRVWRVEGCAVLGRYAIHRETTAEAAASLAAARAAPRARQYLGWKGKGVAKRLAGGLYARARERLLRRSYA